MNDDNGFMINNLIWKINFVKPYSPFLETQYGNFTFGVCDNTNQQIYIASNLTGATLKKVLCHEIAHAVLYSYQVYLPVKEDELFADMMATYGEEILYLTNIYYKKRN